MRANRLLRLARTRSALVHSQPVSLLSPRCCRFAHVRRGGLFWQRRQVLESEIDKLMLTVRSTATRGAETDMFDRTIRALRAKSAVLNRLLSDAVAHGIPWRLD